MVVILDNIRSLHNVGSIFRTSDALGIQKIYLCGITPSPLDRFGEVRQEVAKTALGAEKTVAWKKVDDASVVIGQLKKEGFDVLALEQDPASVSLEKISDIKFGRLALVVGAEVEGVSKTLLEKVDTIVEIPMHGEKESLNVSVAFGIAAFYLRTKFLKNG